MENTIRTKAYLPGAAEYDKYFSKFRAFMGAKLSEKAKEKDALENDTYKDKGHFFMRTPLAGSSCTVWAGYDCGVRGWKDSRNGVAGLRVAFQLIYDRNSSLVKGCKNKTQESLVFDKDGWEDIKIKSTAPIVKFGEKECIWLNKEECENGSAKTMELWTLELIDRAVPFDIDGNNNDYARATEIQEQCYTALTENCTEEEKKMLVKVEMSSEDGYDKVTPIFEKEDLVENLFKKLLEGEIDAEELKESLKAISQKAREEAQESGDADAALAKVKQIGEKISEQTKLYVQEVERRKTADKEKAEKEKKIKDAFDGLENQIDNINLGGE